MSRFRLRSLSILKPCFKDCSLVESVLLLFPVFVTLCTALVFLFGGHVTPWIWWGNLLGAFLFIARWGNVTPRVRIGNGLFLLALLGISWVVAGIVYVKAAIDFSAYHYPAVRLLIEGWNPVYDATPEAITATMGVDSIGMRVWHVLSMPKAVWYFSASAYAFFKTPFNLLFPLFPFLLLSTAFSVLRFVHLSKKWVGGIAGVLLLSLVYCTAYIYPFTVDAYVGLAAIGLLVTMGMSLTGDCKRHLLPLIVYSFWMMNSKQSGLLGCFLFWVVFSVVLVWKTRREWRALLIRLMGLAGILAGTFLISSASPYLTQWVNYGHPLYPCYTVDEEKAPVHNIVYDFYEQNEDCKAMGHLGYFTNAYVSRGLAKRYYCWKLGQKTFAPRQMTWRNKSSPDSPVTKKTRVLFLLSTLLALLFGCNRLRLLVGMVWLTLFLVPTPMLGYQRYVPWCGSLIVFAVLAIVRSRNGWKKTVALLVLGGWLLPEANNKFQNTLSRVDNTYVYKRYLLKYPPREMFYTGDLPSNEKSVQNGFRGSLGKQANLELLKRQEPALSNAALVRLSKDTDKKQLYYFSDLQFYVSREKVKFEKSLASEVSKCRRGNLLNYPRVAKDILFKRLPRLVWYRVRELFE